MKHHIMKEKILIAGGSGLVGGYLTQLLKEEYIVHILSRSKKNDEGSVRYFRWDTRAMTIDHAALAVDHIINLAGAGIADKRWTKDRKQVIIESRVASTRLIKQGLAASGHRPKSYIAASAIGYYGDRGTKILDESSEVGDGFMAETCDTWEAAARELRPLVDRWAAVRIGIVLSSLGGALPKVLMTKALGLYSYFGSGRQYYSWIHIEDLARIFKTIIEDPRFNGVYNGVAPEPATNYEFTKEVKHAVSSWGLLLPAPAFALRLVMGDMADVILNSNRVVPKQLVIDKFEFKHPDLKRAVKDIMERNV